MQHSFLFCVLYKNTWHVKNGIIFRVTVIQTMLHKERKLFCVLIVLLLCSGLRGKALDAKMRRCLECKYAKMLDAKMLSCRSQHHCRAQPEVPRWPPGGGAVGSVLGAGRPRLPPQHLRPPHVRAGETGSGVLGQCHDLVRYCHYILEFLNQYSRMNCLYCLCYSLVSVHLRTFFMSNDSTIFERLLDQKLVRDENGSTWNYINICRHAW